MKLIAILIVLCTVRAKNLRKVLKSSKDTLQLYRHFKEAKHVHFLPEEERLRFRIFRHSAEQVASLNEDEAEEAQYELNRFSVMTEQEKHAYLGVNSTIGDHEILDDIDHVIPARARRKKRAVIPDSKMWIDDGQVTQVPDQGNCGSCWAFAAVAVLEAVYKQETGILRKFSEQELLDCTYEDKKSWSFWRDGIYYEDYHKNGCSGGWYYDCFRYIKRDGRLASASDYVYHENDCTCEAGVKRNSLIAAKVTGHTNISPREEGPVIEALAEQVLAVAFTVTNNFFPYKRGVWKDIGCKDISGPSHAVTLVGYTPTYVLSKNSWGADWGDAGYVRFKRNHDHCHLWRYASYPTMSQTDVVDLLKVDTPSDYDPVLTDPHPDCATFSDERDDCGLEECTAADNGGVDWVECKRTCNNCGHNGTYTGECPAGTTRCGGACKHAHMC